MDSQNINSRDVWQGRMLKVSIDTVSLPNGNSVDLEIIRHPGAAAILPIDDQNRVVLVRQVRHATGGWLLEIPAGKLDDKEEPETCARRELREETGLVAGKLTPMGVIWTTPGFTDERIWLFLATELSEVKQSLDVDEVLTIERYEFDDALTMAINGEIEDSKSICALLRARHYL
ncbi:MAG: NUDIX hydrolase [Deltaproteobacteria bacterium]|nr:NUDIX hydrolase [Deltaproteobacteria bacterium]